MRLFAVKEGDIPEETYETFKEMRALVEALPDDILGGTEISCHHICHALGEVYAVEVADGRFDRMSEHSWLVLKRRTFDEDGENTLVIADMYPVAGGCPSLLYTAWCTPWKKLYTEDHGFVRNKLERAEFLSETALIRDCFVRDRNILFACAA